MMRKRLSLFALAVLLVFAAGCGKYADEAPKGDSSASNTQSTGSNTNTDTGSKGSSSSGTSSTTNTGGQSGNTTTAPAKKAPDPLPVEKVKLGPLKIGEPATVGPITVTLIEMAVFTKGAGLPPNYVHAVAHLKVEYNGTDKYTINVTDHMKMETPEGKKAPFNLQATAHKDPRLQGTVERGKFIEGWLGYLTKRVAGQYKYMFIHPDFGEATWEFSI
ncbi:MAG: DUF4352 domain-containing protein [Bacillota bacterium]